MKVLSGQYIKSVMEVGMAGLMAKKLLKTGCSILFIQIVQLRILSIRKIRLFKKEKLPQFSKAAVKLVFSASPAALRQWANLLRGKLEDKLQNTVRSCFGRMPMHSNLKFPAFYSGYFRYRDSVVTLNGITVYSGVNKIFNYSKVH